MSTNAKHYILVILSKTYANLPGQYSSIRKKSKCIISHKVLQFGEIGATEENLQSSYLNWTWHKWSFIKDQQTYNYI